MRTLANIKSRMGAVLYEDDEGDYVTLAISGDSPRAAKANAQTWATAHNTANAIDTMGHNGDVAIGQELVTMIEFAQAAIDEEAGHQEFAEILKDFMQSIQRKDDEPSQ